LERLQSDCSQARYSLLDVEHCATTGDIPKVLADTRAENAVGRNDRRTRGGSWVIMDEGVISPVEAEEFIRLNMIDGLTIKVSRCGGLASAKRQIGSRWIPDSFGLAAD